MNVPTTLIIVMEMRPAQTLPEASFAPATLVTQVMESTVPVSQWLVMYVSFMIHSYSQI